MQKYKHRSLQMKTPELTGGYGKVQQIIKVTLAPAYALPPDKSDQAV